MTYSQDSEGQHNGAESTPAIGNLRSAPVRIKMIWTWCYGPGAAAADTAESRA
jgi:hypothetical protein